MEELKQLVQKYEVSHEEFEYIWDKCYSCQLVSDLDEYAQRGFLLYNVKLDDFDETHLTYEVKYIPDDNRLRRECGIKILDILKDATKCEMYELKKYITEINKFNKIHVDDKVSDLINEIITGSKQVDKIKSNIYSQIRKTAKYLDDLIQ